MELGYFMGKGCLNLRETRFFLFLLGLCMDLIRLLFEERVLDVLVKVRDFFLY